MDERASQWHHIHGTAGQRLDDLLANSLREIIRMRKLLFLWGNIETENEPSHRGNL